MQQNLTYWSYCRRRWTSSCLFLAFRPSTFLQRKIPLPLKRFLFHCSFVSVILVIYLFAIVLSQVFGVFCLLFSSTRFFMVTQNMGIPSTFYTMRHFSGLCSFIFWFVFLTSLAILLIFFSVTELFIFEKTSDKFFNVKTGWMKAFDFWRVLGVPKQPPQTIWVVTNFNAHPFLHLT